MAPKPDKRAKKKRHPRLAAAARKIVAWVAGLIMAALVFGLLPLMQIIGDRSRDAESTVRTVDVSEPPPVEEVELEEPPPPEEVEEEPEPELTDALDAPPLDALADSLDAARGGGNALLNQAMSGMRGAAAGAFQMSNSDIKPKATRQVPPKYPPDLARQRVEGVVILEFIVDANGRVANPRVVDSPHRGFEQPALQAIRQWRFEPGQRDGKRVAMKLSQPIRFALN